MAVPPLIISGITVPAGGVATIIYVARTNVYAPLETAGVITNTAIVSGGYFICFMKRNFSIHNIINDCQKNI